MGFKDIIKRFGASNKETSPSTSSAEVKGFKKLVINLYKEAKKDNTYFYGSFKFGEYPSYIELKKEDDNYKIGLIFYLLPIINSEQKRLNKQRQWTSGDQTREIHG